MDDKELVEVWRKDFEELMRKTYPLHPLKRLPDNSAYINRDVFYLEQGFLLAKLSQPSVVLPKGHLMDDPDRMGRGRYLMIESVERAITRAGYNYEVKE